MTHFVTFSSVALGPVCPAVVPQFFTNWAHQAQYATYAHTFLLGFFVIIENKRLVNPTPKRKVLACAHFLLRQSHLGLLRSTPLVLVQTRSDSSDPFAGSQYRTTHELFQRQIAIPELVTQLQTIVRRLEQLFPGRHFTLDGHLVGSLAEVIASYVYDLELLPSSYQCHDGRCPKTGTNVQIKGTQRNRVAMYGEADHLIVLQLGIGRADEIYNGPGAAPWAAAGPMAKKWAEEYFP